MINEQLFIGDTIPTIEKFTSVKSRFFVKPFGGLWTSTYNKLFGSEWLEWCKDNDFYTSEKMNGFILKPSKNARIYTIDTYQDLASLMEKYEEKMPGLPDGVELFSIRYPNFELLSKDYDAIHLTDKGQWETRMSHPYSLYGWDCECTLWLNWSFDEVKEVGIKRLINKGEKNDTFI